MNLERVSYKGWKNCLRLGNGKVELVVTTDVGPRVISFGFAGGQNLWDVELAPWAATVLKSGGRLIFPQEPYRPHPEYLLPARPLVLWHYTDMGDPRWIWGRKYIQLRQDTNANTKQKLGLINTLGWGACCLGEEVFIKRYAYQPGADYADMGTNTQIFTDSDMIEFETLGPLTKVPAGGGSVEHTEVWYLAEARVGEDESEIESKILPLVKATDKLWSDW